MYRAVLPHKDKNPRLKWRLVGDRTDIASSGEIFITPANLPGGQYTLYCTYVSDKGKTTTSKVLIVGSKNTCGVIREITNVLQPQTESKNIIYPNPTTGNITIGFKNSKGEKIVRIKDLMGREVLQSQRTNDNELKIDVYNLPDGIYFVEITFGGEIEANK